MGTFYTSMVLRHGGAAPVLRQFGIRGSVVDLEDGFFLVVDAQSDESGDPEDLGNVAATLSHHLRTPVVSALNHDDDLLLMGLFEDGQLVAEWGWRQLFTRWTIPGGKEEAFCQAVRRALGTSAKPAPAAGVFMRLFARTQHERVAAHTGLPPSAVGLGYRYIQQGELPVELRRSRVDVP